MLPLAVRDTVALLPMAATTSVGCWVICRDAPVPMVTVSELTVLPLPSVILQYTDMPSNLVLMVSVRLPALLPPHTVQASLPASL